MPKKGKGKGKDNEAKKNRYLEFAEGENESYAKVISCVGGCRLKVILPEKEEKLAIIPGRFRKKVWIAAGDIILVSLRDFEKKSEDSTNKDDKVDVIHKYTSEEARILYSHKEIPSFFLFSDGEIDNDVQFNINSDSDEEINIDDI